MGYDKCDIVELRLLFDSDKTYLFNPYHVMAVNPAKFPSVRYDLAKKYIDFVTSPQGQDIIRNYGKDKYGTALFVPAADSMDSG